MRQQRQFLIHDGNRARIDMRGNGRAEILSVEFERAAKAAPGSARYSYVWAVALDSVGQTSRAIEVLSAAEKAHGGNREILEALMSFHAKAGHRDAAASYERKLQNRTGPSPNPPE